jgi:hypothetical protein
VAAHLEHNQHQPENRSGDHQRPSHLAAHDALRQRRHQTRLWRGQLGIAKPRAAAFNIADMQNIERKIHHQAG